MPGDPPNTRFRLPSTFSVQPELAADEGPARGILIGQNAPGRATDGIYLGKHAEPPHKDVWMDIRGAHVLYVMGKRRSGKSYTLGAIAEALVARGWIRQGEFDQAVLILDTMNVFLTFPYSVAETHPDASETMQELNRWRIDLEQTPVTLFAPAGTEMPADVDHTVVTLRASDLDAEEWCGLFEVDPFVDPMGHLMTSLHAKVALDGYRDKTNGQVFVPQEIFGVDELLAALDRDTELDGFPQDTREALRRRLTAVARSSVFSQEGLDVRSLLRPGEISILLLRDLDHEMRSVMVSLIVKRIMRLRANSEQQERMIPVHLARAERFESSDPAKADNERALAEECRKRAGQGLPRCWLIIDEAHNYVPSRLNVPSRKPLKKYVDEGRNLGLSIVVATQQPSGLDPSLQRNADLLLIHALSHQDDINAALGMINTAYPDEIVVEGRQKFSGPRSFSALVRGLSVGYAIASSDRANRLFPLKVRPRSTVHGGADY